MRHGAHVTIIALAATLIPSLAAVAESPARIYVYVVPMETHARSWFPITCDGTVVARVKRGRFFAINVAPGRHLLSDEKGVPVSVDARSGEDLYVTLGWRVEVGGPAISVLQVVVPAVGSRDIIDLTYVDADKVLSQSVPKTDPRPAPHLMRRGKSDDE